MPLVLFYPVDVDNKHSSAVRSNYLKKSLSETLTRFYPLAGRVIDNIYVDCNDEGVPYVEARVNCQLSEVIRNPIPGELNKFLPYELDDTNDLGMAIQVNFFDCGGLAVGVLISHKIADAFSFIMFVNNWAATARGDSDLHCPRFESATLFPPIDITSFKPSIGMTKENIVTKRFVFIASKIAALRDKYTENTINNGPIRPTRIEALSAFIWSRFIAATGIKADPNKLYLVLHAVNLRPRFDPPLPDYSFGNISRISIAVPSMDSEEPCYGIVKKMRDAIRGVDSNYVTNLREGDQHLNFIKELGENYTKGDLVSFSFTSLCRFPLHEADFGWGMPIWVGSASLTFKNLVSFLDTPSRDGIEAWVNLDEEDMVKFEDDRELRAFVSPSHGVEQ
ncbi:unnamed protein product [Ilex paraguariensis]|uniref:Uncharacterized protein n=1 Tax=Ilex paraguariensis TaxID=185542 RepID=A0ABC8QXT2_9AQUA